MNKAYIDTTVLTDRLIKEGAASDSVRAAMARYDETQLPVYAIREFKAGPLANFVYFHNKLVSEGSFDAAIAALQRLSMTPQRYKTATSVQALQQAAQQVRSVTSGELVKQYGQDASLDSMLRDLYRLSLEVIIKKAWKQRRGVTTHVVHELNSYPEVPPKKDARGLLELDPKTCQPQGECCLAPLLRSSIDDLTKLRAAVDKMPESNEKRRRLRVLREIIRKPKNKITVSTCRDLGDAVFALMCPRDCVVLTTNLRDHDPLTAALGKRAVAP